MGQATISWHHDPATGLLTGTLIVPREDGGQPLQLTASANITAARAMLNTVYLPKLRALFAAQPHAVSGALHAAAVGCAAAGCASQMAMQVGASGDITVRSLVTGKPFVTSAKDLKAFRMYFSTGSHYLQHEGQAQLDAELYANKARILSDDNFAAQQWSRVSNQNRHWIRPHFVAYEDRGLLGDIAHAVTTAPASIIKAVKKNPVAAAALTPLLSPVLGPAALQAATSVAISATKPLRDVRNIVAKAIPVPGVKEGLAMLDKAVDDAKRGKPINPAQLAKGALGVLGPQLPVDVQHAVGPLTDAVATASKINKNAGAVLKSAAAVVQKLKAGDPSAVAAVKQMVNQAAAGVPDAQHAVSLLEQLAKPMGLPAAKPMALARDLLSSLDKAAASGRWDGPTWLLG